MKNSFLTIVVILVLTAGNAVAQHFEWVRGYAPGNQASIVGSVTDSLGNLYILGSINFNTCWENGSRLLPIAPFNSPNDNGDILIAKISPAGDLVWHKVIHSNYSPKEPYDIKPVGDTAFACLVSIRPADPYYYYLYYLDTLVNPTWQYGDSIAPYPDYPISYQGINGPGCDALITFDFDGNVLEQHFLWMSYLDYNGNDILFTSPNLSDSMLSCGLFKYPSFDIDGDGNIYLSRWTYEMASGGPIAGNYSVEDGTISAVKFWCDRRVVGIAPADSNKHFSPQILKFSPHFDTLLGSRYVYQNRIVDVNCWETKLYYHTPYIYACFLLVPNNTKNLIVFDSTNGIQTRVDYNRHAEKGVIIRYDSTLTAANGSIILEDTITNPATFQGLMFVLLNDIVFDRDSNLAIVSVTAHKGIDGIPEQNMDNSHFMVNGNYVDFHQNAGIIILDEETLELKSTGQLSTSDNSWNNTKLGTGTDGNLSCFNNRVFFQAKFKGSIHFPNYVIQTASGSGYGLCLSVFDYNGSLVEGIDYRTQSTQNWPGTIGMKDSILYLTNLLVTGATFGDIQVPSRGTYFACIAKYVDPAFMQPHRPVNISTVDDALMTVTPNPATDRVQVSLPVSEPVTAAWVVDLTGRRRPVPVSGHVVDLSTAPSGILILQFATSNHLYNHKIIKL